MGLDPIKLYQKDFHFPEEATLRQNLKDYYSNIGFELEQDFLNTTPTIATGILHRLIPGGHLDNPIGVCNIIEIAKTDYKLVMEGRLRIFFFTGNK